ncbi:uncharacterized protein LY79DRAFT_662789 [Colletotrichum navitas]|uniref:Uncharacterized protein n=1 Tax=Colletotrichum navitas TaxID=681940 RepID=A0AAD8PPM5_9PEZI|nr:uncharacterized protein LY79DRAFT_662789 [Colletotrichum navitas]KAK1573439.1 hypothetical protein LY79DRAFT_662789 [Colletotrichum navitas]
MGPAGCVVHGNIQPSWRLTKWDESTVDFPPRDPSVAHCAPYSVVHRSVRCLSVTYDLSRAGRVWRTRGNMEHAATTTVASSRELGLVPVEMPMRTSGTLIFYGFFSSTSVLGPFASHLCRASDTQSRASREPELDGREVCPGACGTVRRGA